MIFLTTAGQTYANERFDDAVTVLAPGVRLVGTRHYGSSPSQPLITTGPGTILEHPYLEGSPGQRRGILVNSADVYIARPEIYGITYTDDAQGIVGWDGTRNLVVDGGHIEASGENIMFGGASPTTEAGTPQDILISGVTLRKPLEWKTKAAYGYLTCKNLFEIKNGKRITVEDCRGLNSWRDGQDGYAVLLTVQDQDRTAPWTTIEDIALRRNTFTNVANGVQILGRDYRTASVRMRNITIEDTEFELAPAANGGRGALFSINDGPDGLALRRITARSRSLPNSFLAFENGVTTELEVDRLDVFEGEYGIHSPTAALGTATLTAYAPGYRWSNVTVRRDPAVGRNIPYPAGTTVIG